MSRCARSKLVLMALGMLALMLMLSLPGLAGAATGSITYCDMTYSNGNYSMAPGSVIRVHSGITLGSSVTLDPIPTYAVAWSNANAGLDHPLAYLEWDIQSGRTVQVNGDITLVAVRPNAWLGSLPPYPNQASTNDTRFVMALNAPAGNGAGQLSADLFYQPPFNVTGTITNVTYHWNPPEPQFHYQVPTFHYFYMPPIGMFWNATTRTLVPLQIEADLQRQGASQVLLYDTGQVITAWVCTWNGNYFPNYTGRLDPALPNPLNPIVLPDGLAFGPNTWDNAFFVYSLGMPIATYEVSFLPGSGGDWLATDHVYTGVPAGDATPQPFSDMSNPPALPGWTFTGWDPPLAPTVTGNDIYTAQWTRTEYTVSFDPGVAGLWSQSMYTFTNLNYGDPTPPAPETLGLPGWTFAGWDPALSTLVDGNATYTALWTRNEYTVTFLPGDHGTFAETQYISLHYGDPTPVGPAPTGAAGWKFIGWSPTPAATVTGNATYTAQWAKIPADTPLVPPTGDATVLAMAPLIAGLGLATLWRGLVRRNRQRPN